MSKNDAGADDLLGEESFLRSLHLEEAALPTGQITQAERRLLEKIRHGKTPNTVPGLIDPAPTTIPRLPQKRRWMAAASIILLAAGIGASYYGRSRPPEWRTAYGEVRTNQLPDGTEVVVNADSKLIYSTGWKDGKDREVWLTGEAFFHVRRTPLKSRFIVHAGHVDIIVTGTRFNVVNRQDQANIMLEEGSVTLHTNGGKEMKMMPGDFVEVQDTRLERRQVKNDSVLAWKEHKLIFDNTPARELVKIIREHYGITVQLAGDSVGNKTLSGILPNDNLEVLLQALDATPDFEVVREGHNILIKKHS